MLFAAGLLAAALFDVPAGAQAPAAPPPESETADAVPLIGRVTVTGNAFVDSTRILRTFEVPSGVRFSQDMVRRGTRKLIALGLFSDVTLRKNEHDGIIDLTIVVKERPRLAAVKFTGNKKREDVDLEKKLFLKAGDTYSAVLTRTQTDSLLKYYHNEGFPRAQVSVKVDTVSGRNEVNLTYLVVEGEKLRITTIRFVGDSSFAVGRMRKAMKTKTKGFFGGGDLKDETFAEDREKLESFYHDHGYRDMKVEDFKLTPGAKPQELTLTVTLKAGRPYVFGSVSWTGNKVVGAATLERLWPGRKGGAYDHSRIERATGGAYAEYAEHGFLYINVDPRETVRDSAIDVTFAITEGAPSHVRLVSITGNRSTREHVIRRELDIHEGDLFRRSALVRSQDDIRRLALFEEAVPDFTPAESTDVDLVFKVKEKQVGTASAGAGYTSQTGLTGFLEIGHNNVLGNGQSLAVHLERGGRVEDYSLSFTEPWFHDAPTLLGFSAYSTIRQLTEFDQRRRGASARIGRPLPWPDYSRGSISYTLENIRISNVRDSISLTGVKIGVDQLTSSFETSFLRNSTDNPFYPTRGTRLSANEEFTGGPLLGDLNYHKHRYEGRAYLPSPFKRMVTMARLRIGLLGQYPWKSGPIPDYARFRLGGGNTLDPLRGYQDYQIVPDKFLRHDSTFVKTDVNLTDGTDTLKFNGIRTTRYPGGRYMALFTLEEQFPIVHPLHGVLFFDAGNVWDLRREIRPFKLKAGAGIGFRMSLYLIPC